LPYDVDKAFGSRPDSLGIVVVKDLPPAYPKLRENLLLLANAFASLPDPVREKYADAASKYRYERAERASLRKDQHSADGLRNTLASDGLMERRVRFW
jgi:hypothetical protein